MGVAGFWTRRVRRPLVALLRAGATPEKLALSLGLGAVIGIFPVLGTTTLLCVVAALLLRLNPVAIQITNYLVYPAHLALLLPFVRAGERLYGAPPVPLSLAVLRASFAADGLGTLARFGGTVLHAVTAWSLAAPLLVAATYFTFLPLMRRLAARSRVQAETPAPSALSGTPP
jgi:uncharacterized protein (DUF2062 family)